MFTFCTGWCVHFWTVFILLLCFFFFFLMEVFSSCHCSAGKLVLRMFSVINIERPCRPSKVEKKKKPTSITMTMGNQNWSVWFLSHKICRECCYEGSLNKGSMRVPSCLRLSVLVCVHVWGGSPMTKVVGLRGWEEAFTRPGWIHVSVLGPPLTPPLHTRTHKRLSSYLFPKW